MGDGRRGARWIGGHGGGSASQVWEELRVVVASVSVTLLLLVVALEPIRVDPIDDVLMAILYRLLYALVTAPRARRALRASPRQNVQVPFPRCKRTSRLIPRARRVLRT